MGLKYDYDSIMHYSRNTFSKVKKQSIKSKVLFSSITYAFSNVKKQSIKNQSLFLK